MSNEEVKLKPGDAYEYEHNGKIHQLRVLSFNEKASIQKMLVEMQSNKGDFFEIAEKMAQLVLANFEQSLLDTIDETDVMELVQLALQNCYLSLSDKKKQG